MRALLICFAFFLKSSCVLAQDVFHIKNDRNKTTIPFKFINNLIIIPIEVNGTPLNFLLDTGVKETILFSLDESNEIKLLNLEKMKFVGFGKKEPFEGLKSSNNSFKIKKFINENHTIYIVLDQEINISYKVGIPVNGVIGSHFFASKPVKIDFRNRKITIFNNNSLLEKNMANKYQKIPITIEEGKPYLQASIQMISETTSHLSKLLIDVGNSDALWLFQNKKTSITIPEKHFDDYLGNGFSGDIFGKRGRIQALSIGGFKFNNPIVAIPDSVATNNLEMVANRNGSIGAEIIKRFAIVFDYKSNFIYLKKNQNFTTNFNYNTSGIEVQHDGLQWIKSTSVNRKSNREGLVFESESNSITKKLDYEFVLKPIYGVFYVRKNSPADLAGIKMGDIIIKINGKSCNNLNLNEINEILKSIETQFISIELDRKGVKLKFNFKTQNEL
jgi:PDZ domain/Aspartyl protease